MGMPAYVDRTNSEGLWKRFDIKVNPTTYIFSSGKMYRYSGGADGSKLLKFVKDFAEVYPAPPSQEVPPDPNFDYEARASAGKGYVTRFDILWDSTLRYLGFRKEGKPLAELYTQSLQPDAAESDHVVTNGEVLVDRVLRFFGIRTGGEEL